MVAALACLIVAIVAAREMLLRSECPRAHHEPFDGVVHRVGEAAVAVRKSEEPRATVVAMHGYTEDMRYFARLYRDPSIELIALTSCAYHVPVTGLALTVPEWARVPDAPHGTIAYDAAVLNQALEYLPRTRNVRVHGHSRGGAVVLEAARMRPDLFAAVEVVLEAPVLPRGRLYAAPLPLLLWFYPFIVMAWRRGPLGRFFVPAFGALDDARKRELLAGLPHSARRIATFVANVEDLIAWMRDADTRLYDNVRRGTILVPNRDRVLDPGAMLASAKSAEPTLGVVRVDTSHFVTLDRPSAIPPLLAPPLPSTTG
jgi:pimeloyl-ACP methyl ester carboxylesterase